MENKYIKIIVGVVIVAAVVVLLSLIKTKTPSNNPASNNSGTAPTNQVLYVSGQVTKVSSSEVVFKTPAGQTLTAQVTSTTKIIKQVMDAKGVLQMPAGKLSDIKVGSEIFTPVAGSEKATYTPAFIQIIK